tara:strand:- start:1953 stop:2825 length:873 start_codon:yes stop_codon:yes gene_type:complete
MPNVEKVVIPAAGLGTRFLPATKASPKEMLTVVDKPLIQFAAEEAFDAGITELIFIISRNKNVIEDHFDKSYELESELEKKNKRESLELVKQLVPQGVTCTYIRQAEPLGLGHAVLCAASAVNDENFAVLLPDDLIKSDNRGCLKQMLEEFEEGIDAILAVEKISLSESKKYGIIDPGARRGRIIDVNGIIEKPQPEDASSDFGVVGRYIFTPKILSLLRDLPAGAGNEIQLTDGIASLVSGSQVKAYEFEGARYDCGSKLGFLKANVDYAIEHPIVGSEFRDWLKGRVD